MNMKNNNKGIIHLLPLIIIGVIIIGVVVFVMGGNSETPFVSQTSPTPEAMDEMVGWKTYTSEEFNISFKHPPSWEQLAENNTRTEFEDSAIVKDLPRETVNQEYCTQQRDCYPVAQIKLSYADQIVDGSNLGWKAEEKMINGMQITFVYYSDEAPYPTMTYFVLPDGKILLAESWLPSHTNCQGQCPVYEDSEEIKKVGKEITQILSTFEFTN